ncbi:Protein of unknown function [Pyronema omphalodes CBS 100304]|uniref:Uncharacterized protein n=1 Tax=Pyronema omphalodes (strain CBS 100304) TaxID=1076935 RepID=U4LFC8_PYROM|nr:Protein of unknown function [Pyronema omphalodes CBS 100304]
MFALTIPPAANISPPRPPDKTFTDIYTPSRRQYCAYFLWSLDVTRSVPLHHARKDFLTRAPTGFIRTSKYGKIHSRDCPTNPLCHPSP